MELRAGKVLITEDRIAERVSALAREINRSYGGSPVTLVGVLDGCLIFLSDLVRRLDMPLEIALVRVKTYGNSTRPEKKPIIPEDDAARVRGQNVLVVDDIYDSGETLAALTRALEVAGARTLKTCIFLAKDHPHEQALNIDYVGFTVPDVFVVGYGLDYAGKYRNLPYVAELEGADTDTAFA